MTLVLPLSTQRYNLTIEVNAPDGTRAGTAILTIDGWPPRGFTLRAYDLSGVEILVPQETSSPSSRTEPTWRDIVAALALQAPDGVVVDDGLLARGRYEVITVTNAPLGTRRITVSGAGRWPTRPPLPPPTPALPEIPVIPEEPSPEASRFAGLGRVGG